MTTYNYLTYYQEQLNRAIELLDTTSLKDNPLAVEEAITALKILARTRPVYKKAMGTNEYVQVGVLTTKNEIIFNTPKDSLYAKTKNLGRSSNVYWSGWFIFIDVETRVQEQETITTQREEYLSHFDITNRHMFQEILYSQTPRDEVEKDNSSVLGFIMGDYRNAEVIFYDQYKNPH